ncbi:MAG TPA: hypothetical protein VGJ20_03845 [Xanthobacteraceae bacterium]
MVLLLIAIVAGTVVLFGIAFWRRPDAVEQISLAWARAPSCCGSSALP